MMDAWVLLLLILIQMEAIYLIGRNTGLRPIRTSNSEIISLQKRDIGPREPTPPPYFN